MRDTLDAVHARGMETPSTEVGNSVDALTAKFRDDVIGGLSCRQKRVPSRWLYDDRGSELFEESTRVPEYYPARVETGILHDCGRAIANFCGENMTIVEYGAGAGTKTEILLRALRTPRIYLPVDISADYLDTTAKRMRRVFPKLATRPIAADFSTDFELPDWIPSCNRVVFFPGSTIGNLNGDEVGAILKRMRVLVGRSGKAIVGVDLRKPLEVLLPAYDDACGTTARFNLNLLTRINRELFGQFKLENFRHVVKWNEAEAAVEMHLVSRGPQSVTVAGREFRFETGESIHTESSRKFEIASFRELVRPNGWRVGRVWTDDLAQFALFGLI